MQVDASPLAMSCLIEAALDEQNRAIRQEVVRRLDLLDVDADWLQNLGKRYRATWDQAVGGGYHGSLETVSEAAPLFMSWLLATSRDPDLLAEFNADLRIRVAHAYYGATGSSDDIPVVHGIGVTVGTVCRPVVSIAQLLPALFPGRQVDADAEEAYAGLVEHAVAAEALNWPEMARTSVLWRLGGIAQGLTDGAPLVESLRTMSRALERALPRADRFATGEDWLKAYGLNRNGLTHVRPSDKDIGFLEAASHVGDPESVAIYLRLASYYTAAAINQILRTLDPSGVSGLIAALDRDFDWVEID